jgi:glycosyltransferase involved in cell wall biosynthesis
MTLLLDAGDYPLGQETIGGIGLRVAELAAALSQHFPVYVYSPATADDEPVDVGDAQLVTAAADWAGLLTGAVVMFFFDMPDPRRLEQAVTSSKIIVSENAAPIEQLEYPRLRRHGVFDTGTYQRLVDTYRYQLTHSDLFVARSAIERVTLIANLGAYGVLSVADLDRSRVLEHRIITIPIGFSATAIGSAHRSSASQRGEVLWTGGLWEFMDPAAAVRAVAAARADGTEVTLRFLHAAPHPDTERTRTGVTALARELNVTQHVVLHTDPIRHSDRGRYLREAAALICLARPGIENETCVRLRVRDCRLYGLPLLVDRFGATATELAADGLAIPVDPADTGSIAEYLKLLVADSRPPQPSGQDEWAYERTTAPLTAWLRSRLS